MIERMPFGRTGHESSRTVFGAAALAAMSEARCETAFETLLEFGVNHIDTAASYGKSELRLRPFLADHRAAVERGLEVKKIGNEILETIAVVGARDEIAGKLRTRLAGIADGVTLTHNRCPDPHHWADVVAELKSGDGL